GLVHVLRDLMSLSRVVQSTAIKNLDVIASGPEASNPAELLSAPHLHEFLARARDSYDTVIVDSPSLLEVADPSIVGAVADAILLVVRSSATKRDDAGRALEIVKGLGIPVLGAMVNGVGTSVPSSLRIRLRPETEPQTVDRPSGEI